MDTQEAFIRLMVAVVLGAAIGFERQWRNHYAGLRTNTLITIGSAGLMVFAQTLQHADATSLSRIAGQIITGVGFLCAGVIMHEGINVKGLNTSATLWCSTAVGVFAGAGQFSAAAMLATLIVLTNLLLRPVVRYINSRTLPSDELDAHYTISVNCNYADVPRLRAAILSHLGAFTTHLKKVETKHVEGGAVINADLMFHQRMDGKVEFITGQIAREAGVTAILWHIA